MNAKAENLVVRQQIDESHYTVFTPDVLSESQFQSLLTPEERAHQMAPKGFIEPAPFRLPDQAGTFVHIRGSLKE